MHTVFGCWGRSREILSVGHRLPCRGQQSCGSQAGRDLAHTYLARVPLPPHHAKSECLGLCWDTTVWQSSGPGSTGRTLKKGKPKKSATRRGNTPMGIFFFRKKGLNLWVRFCGIMRKSVISNENIRNIDIFHFLNRIIKFSAHKCLIIIRKNSRPSSQSEKKS